MMLQTIETSELYATLGHRQRQDASRPLMQYYEGGICSAVSTCKEARLPRKARSPTYRRHSGDIDRLRVHH